MSARTKNALPTGWRWARIGGHDGIATIVNGSTPSSGEPRFWNGNILWTTPADLGKLDDIYLRDTERKITEEGYNSCSTQLLPAGTVLLTSRAPVGNIAIAAHEMCTNQGFKSLVPREGVDSLYVYFAVRAIVPQIQKKAHGNTFNELTKPALSQFEIPLPPTFEEQREIGFRLRDTVETTRRLRRAAERQIEVCDAFELSFLQQTFDKPAAIDWMRTKLGDLAEIVMGQSPDGSTYNKTGDGSPLLNGPTEFGDDHPTPAQWTTNPKKFCQPDDLLICVRGNTTGRMNRANRVYALGRGVAAVRGRKGKGHTRFIRHAIHYRLATLLAGSERSTFPNIGKEDIAGFEIFAPADPGVQERFAVECDAKLSQVRSLHAAVERQAEAISALPAATLLEFFNFGNGVHG